MQAFSTSPFVANTQIRWSMSVSTFGELRKFDEQIEAYNIGIYTCLNRRTSAVSPNIEILILFRRLKNYIIL